MTIQEIKNETNTDILVNKLRELANRSPYSSKTAKYIRRLRELNYQLPEFINQI